MSPFPLGRGKAVHLLQVAEELPGIAPHVLKGPESWAGPGVARVSGPTFIRENP